MNTILDDISAVIGFSPTQRIAVWYGDTNLYVPSVVDEAHPLAKLIGITCFSALAKAFGKKTLAIPHGAAETDATRRRVAEMVVMGATTDGIAVMVNLSPRQVHNMRDSLREAGLLELVAKRARESARNDRYAKRGPGRPGGNLSGENAPGNFPSENASGYAAMLPNAVERRRASRMAPTPVPEPIPIDQAVERLQAAWSVSKTSGRKP